MDAAGETADRSRPVVLITEDNEKNRKLVRELLGSRGIPYLEAATGAAALTVAAEARPDVVLMDIHLPDMEGTEALAQLRDDARTTHIPVIAVTALAMKGDAERFLAAGFDAYIAKPIDVRTFVDAVVAMAEAGRG